MKRTLLLHILLSVVSYFICYWFVCYHEWRVVHPFQWALDIPNGTSDYRLLMLFMLIAWQLINFKAAYELNVLLHPDKDFKDLRHKKDEGAGKQQ